MIFFDFDGTLVDLWPRYHAVFTDITGLKNVTLAEYKAAKQALIKDSAVAQYLGTNLPDTYFEQKKLMLEEKRYLILDKPFFRKDLFGISQGFLDNGQNLFNDGSIILSKRRNVSNFYWQLENLGIHCKAYVTENKIEWIQQYIEQHGQKSVNADKEEIAKHLIIGDAVTDLKIGLLPNVGVWMVGYGLNTFEQFKSANIDNISFRFFQRPSELLLAINQRREINAI